MTSVGSVNSSSAPSITHFEESSFLKLPYEIIQAIGSLAAEPSLQATCKLLRQILDLRDEWLSLKANAVKPEIDPLLRQFIEEIEAPHRSAETKDQNITVSDKDKFRQLFNRICDYLHIERKAPPNLNGISRYSIEFYSKLLEGVKQDISLLRAWPEIRKQIYMADNRPIPEATVEEIRCFLNQPCNQSVIQQVTRLEFRELQLLTIPQEINLFKGIEYLGLHENQITSVSKNIFDELTALQELNLSKNELAALDPNLFNGLTALRDLHLGENQLTALPRELFNGLTSLEFISLASNKLTALDSDLFNGLTALVHISFVRNQLTVLPSQLFNGLTAVRYINLQFNDFTDLSPDIFKGLTTLQKLYLDGNPLTDLPPDIFNGLTALKLISVQETKLTTLHPDIFKGLTSLESICLRNNKFKALPLNIFYGLTSLENVDLRCNFYLTPPLPSIPKGSIQF